MCPRPSFFSPKGTIDNSDVLGPLESASRKPQAGYRLQFIPGDDGPLVPVFAAAACGRVLDQFCCRQARDRWNIVESNSEVLMDPFEVRMQFLSLIRKLNASQQSIQKVVGFALKFFSQCGEDLWDCIVEECQKGSINNRINILYFLDSLCEASLLAKSRPNALGQGVQPESSFYVDYVGRDLSKIVELVVPEGRIGLPNLMSTKQILEDWRSKRVLDPQKVDDALEVLNTRNVGDDNSPPPSPLVRAPPRQEALPRDEIFKRIEADRERHKRLRERRWVQPVMHAPAHAAPLASFMSLTDDADGAEELTIDIEFENEWETTSNWNEDDDEAVAEENELCYPRSMTRGEAPMDTS